LQCSIELSKHAGFPMMLVRGELDHATCPAFESQLAAFATSPAPLAILNLIDVPYSQAAPLRVVVEAHRALLARGGALAVVCCTEYMAKIIEVAGAKDELCLFHSLDTATAHLLALR